MGEGIRTRPYRFSALKLDELPLSYRVPRLANAMGALLVLGFFLLVLDPLHHPVVHNSLFTAYHAVLTGLGLGFLLIGGVNLIMAYAGPERQFYWKAWSFGFTPTAIGLFQGKSDEPALSFGWRDVRKVMLGAKGAVFILRCEGGAEAVNWRIKISSFESQADWNWFIARLRQQRVPGYELLPHFLSHSEAKRSSPRASTIGLAAEPVLATTLTEDVPLAVESQRVKRLDYFAWVKRMVRYCFVVLIAGTAMLEIPWHPVLGQNCVILTLFALFLSIPAILYFPNLLNPVGSHKVTADGSGLHLVYDGGRTVTTYEWNEFARVVAGQGKLRFVREADEELVLVITALAAPDRAALARLIQGADVWGWEWVADALASPDAGQPLNPQRI